MGPLFELSSERDRKREREVEAEFSTPIFWVTHLFKIESTFQTHHTASFFHYARPSNLNLCN